VPRVDGDVVAEAGQALERVEEVLRALARRDCQVGARGVADEQRVAGQRERAVDEERAVLRAVPRRVQHGDPDVPDLELVPVGERLERVLGFGQRMNRNRQIVLEREAAVSRDVVGVRVRLEHPLDPDAGRRSCFEIRVGLERGVDEDGASRRRVADQVGRTAEVVVHELPEEQHGVRA
jgi:hypothetical protein